MPPTEVLWQLLHCQLYHRGQGGRVQGPGWEFCRMVWKKSSIAQHQENVFVICEFPLWRIKKGKSYLISCRTWLSLSRVSVLWLVRDGTGGGMSDPQSPLWPVRVSPPAGKKTFIITQTSSSLSQGFIKNIDQTTVRQKDALKHLCLFLKWEFKHLNYWNW